VLVHQPAVDPRDRVPLLARRVQVRFQDLVDDRLERVQLRRPGRQRFRCSGHADASALPTVRRPTPYCFSIARPDIPARASRRIAA
jgi:hypothetical protein